MTLNGIETPASALLSFPSAGFNATSSNRIESWIIDTKTLDIVTQIGLIESPNVRGPIRYRLYDSFDTQREFVAANLGDILSIAAESIERIIITTDTVTSDGRPPRNLKLVLNGCFKGDGLVTKAQIETPATGSEFSEISYYE